MILEPAGGGGFGVCCGLVFCVAFGSGCSAFVVVSFALFAGARSVLVLLVPRGGGFVLFFRCLAPRVGRPVEN